MRLSDVVGFAVLGLLVSGIALGVGYSFYFDYMAVVTGRQFCEEQGYSKDYCFFNWDKVQTRVQP